MQAQVSPVCMVPVKVAIIEIASLFCSEAVSFSLPTAFMIAPFPRQSQELVAACICEWNGSLGR